MTRTFEHRLKMQYRCVFPPPHTLHGLTIDGHISAGFMIYYLYQISFFHNNFARKIVRIFSQPFLNLHFVINHGFSLLFPVSKPSSTNV